VLLECLSTGSEELQEACAQALGTIGGRDSVRRLTRLLAEKRTERVIVSGAEAVSKHGVLEAAWEILPRMHAATNPALRRQLAIAMGNLLGQPGEFYEFLTGERTQEGIRLGRLFRRARRAILRVRRTLPAADRSDPVWTDLVAELERIRSLIEGQSHRAALEGLFGIVRRLVRVILGRDLPDAIALEYAMVRDAKLGLGLWFVTEIQHRMGQVADPELLHTDVLLALYFLARYRLPPNSDQKSSP